MKLQADRVLRFDKFACGLPFIAALSHLEQTNDEISLHSQDFWEIEYSISGAGTHFLGDDNRSQETSAGSLSLICATSGHSLKSRGDWQFINVAFRTDDFRKWCEIAGLKNAFNDWKNGDVPIEAQISARQKAECESLFQRMATLFGMARNETQKEQSSRLSLELCRFWSEVMPHFLSESRREMAPPWLESALKKMQNEENLQGGYKRLCDLCCVAPEHLARVFRAVYDQTPTEWINEMRLQRAASLLLSTTRAIDEIGANCGFENHSYFYRLFARRFQMPPRAFRLQAQKVLSP